MKKIEDQSLRIGQALIRIAAYMRRTDLRRRIEECAYEIIEDIHSENERLAKTISKTRIWITLAKALYEIEPINAAMVEDALTDLELEGMKNAAKKDFSIAELLGKSDQGVKESEKGEKGEDESEKGGEEDGNRQYGNAIARQSAILEALRKMEAGRAHLKDIMNLFPEVSERTLRYDLTRLAARGVIERVGAGGPSTFYVIK